MKFVKEKLASKIPVLSLIISLLVAWLVVPLASGFPMIAFFIFFVTVGSLVYFVRQEKTWFDSMLYIGILLLSFFTIYRANEFLQFLDFLAIFFFGSLLIRPLVKEHGVFNMLLSPFIVIGNAFAANNIFPYVIKVPEKYKRTDVFRVIPTIIITVLILLITIPLLASANPFFNALTQNVLNFFNLGWLFKYIFADTIMAYVFRFIAFVTLVFTIPRILSISVEGTRSYKTMRLFSINYLIPKISMAVLLIVFFITQLQLYFASAQTLQSLGYTNSRLTNEVFAQVTIVAFIVFLLAYLDKERKAWNKRLSYFLIVEAFFLVGIAFKSVYDYSSLYGFTQKRLWGYTTMTWLTGALAAFVYHYRNQTPNLGFIKQIMTLTLGVVLLVNILNFDFLIYNFRKPSTHDGVDYKYLASLSPDARQYKEVLANAKTMDIQYQIVNKIEFLRYKYETKKDINSFNITEYQVYLETKDVNTAEYRNKIKNP